MEADIGKLGKILESDGKKMLFYHTDTDGICSASILLKFYPEFETYPLEGPILSNRLLSHLKEAKPEVIVAVDLPLDQEAEKLEGLLREMPDIRIAVIDHHIAEKDMNSDRVVHINPRLDSEAYIPASVIVYKLMKQLKHDADQYLWLAAIGVIGDHAFEDCSDILREAEKRYPDAGTGEDSKLGLLSKQIMATVICHGTKGAEKSVGHLRGTESWEDALRNRYLGSCHKKIENEIREKVSAFAKKAREFQNLDMYIYRIDSNLSIASSVSTILADLHPESVIFVVKKSKQMMKVSGRCQKGDINLNDALKRAVRGIGSGGGHVKAAGAVVPVKDWPEFERRLIRIVEESRSSS